MKYRSHLYDERAAVKGTLLYRRNYYFRMLYLPPGGVREEK